MTEWRMHVWTANGTPRPTITMSDGIASLTRFDRNGAGDCLEASFDADPQAVVVRARDIVQLQARTNEGAWESVYKGFATIVGSERAYGMRSYKLVGLKQRFYEIVLTARSITGADVATMVDDALSGITLPEGVTYASSDVPTLAFEMGTRYPQLETLGDFLDALAESVGAFIVPAGQTYTYDGVTYSAGDTVPAVQWGVDADGALFVRRPQGTPAEAREGAAGTMVRWEDVAAEEVVDRVAFMYGRPEHPYTFRPSYHLIGPRPATPPTPIVTTHGTGPYDAGRAVLLDPPDDFMEAVPPADVGAGPDLWENPENITDLDTSTFATNGTQNGSASRLTVQGPSGSWIASVRFKPAAHRDITVPLYAAPLAPNPFGTSIGAYLVGDSSDLADEDGIVQITFPWPEVARAGAGFHLLVDEGDEVYDVRFYVPDEDAADLLAEAYMRSPNADASSVEVVGRLPEVAASMRLTPIGEAPVVVPVERVETMLTNEDGLVSTYYLAQAFDAELLSERAVLETLAKRAARR